MAVAQVKPRVILQAAGPAIAEAADTKQKTLELLGDLSSVQVMSGRVLVAVYIAPRMITSGSLKLLRTDKAIQEDVWQSSVGLVLKKGSLAFVDDDANKFHGQDVEPGQWVVFRTGDAKRVQINGVDCRMVQDSLIDLVVESPEIITHFQSKE